MRATDARDAQFTKAERYRLSRRTSTLYHKLALYRAHEPLATVERLVSASFGAGGSYVAKHDTLVAWDALPEEERQELFAQGCQRRATRYKQHVTTEDFRRWLRAGPVLIDPFDLKRQQRERDARENHAEATAQGTVQTMLRVFGRDRRDRSHLRLVK